MLPNLFLLSKIFVIVPRDFRGDFIKETAALNLNRGRVITPLIILLESALFIWKWTGPRTQIDSYYMALYAVLTVASMIVYAFVILARRGFISSDLTKLYVGYTFFALMLLWACGITILDQQQYGQIVVFVGVIFALAVAAYVEPVVMLVLYTASLAVLFFGFRLYDVPAAVRIGHEINAVSSGLLAWLVARQHFAHRYRDFLNTRVIAQKNRELALANDGLRDANRRLELISHIDEVTQVANRRAFERAFDGEWRRAMRDRRPIALAFIDVDHFKDFNDLYGHLAGDECLASVARTALTAIRRPGDFVGRFGGEEFILILPDTDKRGAQHICEQIRLRVIDLQIPHGRSSAGGFVSVSIGTASILPRAELDPMDFVDLVDRAMYEAKRLGRNRTVATEPE